MKWFKNKRIGTKLIIGFLVVAVMAAVIGGIGTVNISTLGKDDAVLYKENTLGLLYSSDAAMWYQRVRFNVLKALLAEGTDVQEESIGKIGNYETTVEDNLQKYRGSIMEAEDIALYEGLLPKWDTYKAYVQTLVDMMRAGDVASAKSLVFGDLQAAGNDLQSSFDEIAVVNIADAQKTADSNQQTVRISLLLMISIAAVGVIVALVLGAYISRLIGKPLKSMADSAQQLALGDVDIVIKADTKDEIGALADAFTKVVNSQKNQVHETERLAIGDLTVDISMKSDKDILNKSLITLVDNLNEIIVNIRTSAEQVASGANLVSQTSMALSQGATEQASSVEQLTASIQEIAAQTARNAENAQSANQSAKNAKADAELGNAQMSDMLGAMEDINQSSASINKIIKVIDDIAFQTNILALNAAVEAARAGQHGKGFAVVAEEVRTLAARSAQAAKETTDLIEGSIKRVEAGTRIASQTAAALGKIVTEVAKAANLVEEIAIASNEQSLAIEQVNQGVVMVSSVVQSNAATSEESAAASEELSSQADQLKEIISTFKIKQNTSMSGLASQATAARRTDKLQPAGIGKAVRSSKPAISLGDRDFGKY